MRLYTEKDRIRSARASFFRAARTCSCCVDRERRRRRGTVDLAFLLRLASGTVGSAVRSRPERRRTIRGRAAVDGVLMRTPHLLGDLGSSPPSQECLRTCGARSGLHHLLEFTTSARPHARRLQATLSDKRLQPTRRFGSIGDPTCLCHRAVGAARYSSRVGR